MDQARTAALEALLQVDVREGYSNIVLDKTISRFGLTGLDASFASALFYGVLEKRLTLDYVLSQFSKQPLEKLTPKVLEILRLGTYQILFMDRVPDSASVNESVNLAKRNGAAKASGFVNGVLRSLLRGKDGLSWPNESVRYSCPEWLIALWRSAYGEGAARGLLESLSQPASLFIRVNSVKTSARALAETLLREGVEAEQVPSFPQTLSVKKTGSLPSLASFREGLFHVQDLSSQFAAQQLGAKAGERVIDVCAAPGGKSFTIAEEMQNEGELLAFDKYRGKVRLIADGATRLGLTIVKAHVRDAEHPQKPLMPADRVLCDAPCSGLGIIRRKPEIRYRKKTDLDSLPDLQYRILCEAARLVKPGGRLLYSTCTLNPAQHGGVADRFLQEHGAFRPVPVVLPEGWNHAVKEPVHQLTLFPQMHGTDGFFISLFERNEKGE